MLHRSVITSASVAACFIEQPIIHIASEDAPLPFGRPPQAAFERVRQRAGRSTVRLSAFCFTALCSQQRPSGCCASDAPLSTGRFSAGRFNESCKIDASVVSYRVPVRRPVPFRDPAETGPKDRLARRLSASRSRSRSCASKAPRFHQPSIGSLHRRTCTGLPNVSRIFPPGLSASARASSCSPEFSVASRNSAVRHWDHYRMVTPRKSRRSLPEKSTIH